MARSDSLSPNGRQLGRVRVARRVGDSDHPHEDHRVAVSVRDWDSYTRSGALRGSDGEPQLSHMRCPERVAYDVVLEFDEGTRAQRSCSKPSSTTPQRRACISRRDAYNGHDLTGC